MAIQQKRDKGQIGKLNFGAASRHAEQQNIVYMQHEAHEISQRTIKDDNKTIQGNFPQNSWSATISPFYAY